MPPVPLPHKQALRPLQHGHSVDRAVFFSRVATEEAPRGVNTRRYGRTLSARHGHGRDSDTGSVCREYCDIARQGIFAHVIHGHFMHTRS